MCIDQVLRQLARENVPAFRDYIRRACIQRHTIMIFDAVIYVNRWDAWAMNRYEFQTLYDAIGAFIEEIAA